MMCSYGVDFDINAVCGSLKRIGNQIFKLLPMREEEKDWQKPLCTLLLELVGMASLFREQNTLLSLVSKLEGLRVSDTDFWMFRRTVFECCSMVSELVEQCR